MQTRDFVYRVFLIILMVVLSIGLWYLREALLLIFLAFIIAIGLAKPVQILRRNGFSRTTSVITTLVVTGFIVALLLVVLVPIVVDQVGTLIDELPAAAEEAQTAYNDQARHYGFLPELDSTDDLSAMNIEEFALSQAGAASRNIFPFLSNVGGAMANAIVVIVMAIFILSKPDVYVEGLLTIMPRDYRPRALEVINAVVIAIQNSLAAQIFAMAFIGFLTTVGLMIIGVPNAVALGVIAGLLNFIPTWGSIIALIIGVIFTVATEPDKLLFVVLLYLILQQLESNFLTPRIVNHVLNMPGAVVIMTQIVAGILFGFLGIVLAVPLLALVMVLIRELYVYDALNSRSAQVELTERKDGDLALTLVSNPPYRPEDMTPGQAAALIAQGTDPFDHVDRSMEIIPAEPRREIIIEQRAVWIALFALVTAQVLALMRSFIPGDWLSSDD